MTTIINSITISVYGREFYAPPEYLNGYVFCMSNGSVFVSDKKPIRKEFHWELQGIKFETVGSLPHRLTSKEVTATLKPLKDYLVGGKSDDSWEALCEFTRKHYEAQQQQPEIEEGRLYTWGTGASVYLRANKQVYLVEPHSGSLVNLGPTREFPWLISHYSGFRYVSSWGAGNDKSSD